MKKVVQQQIMRKPLLALAIIFFGVGIAIYTNAGYREGNATMGATMGKDKPATTTTTTTATPTTATPTTAMPTTAPSVDMQSLFKDPEAIKKLLGNPAISSLISSTTSANAPEPNVVSPPMGK
jgi:hypothetical protein